MTLPQDEGAPAPTVRIRPASPEDFEDMWGIFQRVVAPGDTYPFLPDTPREEAQAYWLSPDSRTYVACVGDRVAGMYKLRATIFGLGAHVANASFMVDPAMQGHGIGRSMGEHCLEEARRAGFTAMQFNFVVSTNTQAVALWRKLGFEVAGVLPKAFNHLRLGLVDAYVMYRFL